MLGLYLDRVSRDTQEYLLMINFDLLKNIICLYVKQDQKKPVFICIQILYVNRIRNFDIYQIRYILDLYYICKAFVTSHIEYCATLIDMEETHLDKLQVAQN